MKPLGRKNYGSIPHLPGSRMGPADHHCHDGQRRIATEKKRDKHDFIVVQEKLDGSNVGIAKVNGQILAITRAGYLANTSPYQMHHWFHEWVEYNRNRFDFLAEGERVCGEWLMVAHGTRYNLPHEPFVAFDIMRGPERANYEEFTQRLRDRFTMPRVLSIGEPLAIETMLTMIEVSGHGAIDPVEGAVWRVERKGKVDFLCKYVRPDKVDGKYLDDVVLNGFKRHSIPLRTFTPNFDQK